MGRKAYRNTSKPFVIVLGGGGARGFAHAGILRALEAEGFRPSAIVGVSMGAVVGVTYALRDDWYSALLGMDTDSFPNSFSAHSSEGFWERARLVKHYAQTVRDLIYDWGPGIHALKDGQRLLHTLTLGRNLENGRIPVAVSATDLITGKRVVIRKGNAADAVYASTALAVDPGQMLISRDITTGYQALMRAVEVCHLRHADLRFGQADLVLKPSFPRTIDTLDFDSRRICVAAGIRAVRHQRDQVRRLLSAD